MVVSGIVVVGAVVVDGAVVVLDVVVVVDGTVVVLVVVDSVVSVNAVSPRDFRSSCICSSFRRTFVEGGRSFITSVENPLVRFTY